MSSSRYSLSMMSNICSMRMTLRFTLYPWNLPDYWMSYRSSRSSRSTKYNISLWKYTELTVSTVSMKFMR